MFSKTKKTIIIIILAIIAIYIGITQWGVLLLTDAATRVAYSIEFGVHQLQLTGKSTLTVTHHPRSFPEGCAQDFSIKIDASTHGQLSPRSITVDCLKNGRHGREYYTTYHLNFVRVPQTLEMHFAPNESVLLTIQQVNNSYDLVGLDKTIKK